MKATNWRWAGLTRIVCAIIVLTAGASVAQAIFSPIHHFVSAGAQAYNPAAWVMLNPCPLPPAPASFSDLGNPAQPAISTINHISNQFELTFGAQDSFGYVNFPLLRFWDGAFIPNIPAPDAEGDFYFEGYDQADHAHTFGVSGRLQLLGAGGGPVNPTDWTSLNPCPLPPAPQLPLGLAQMFFDPPGDTTAVFSFSLSIDGGPPVAFREVAVGTPTPEPLTTTLGAASLGGLALVMRRRRAH